MRTTKVPEIMWDEVNGFFFKSDSGEIVTPEEYWDLIEAKIIEPIFPTRKQLTLDQLHNHVIELLDFAEDLSIEVNNPDMKVGQTKPIDWYCKTIEIPLNKIEYHIRQDNDPSSATYRQVLYDRKVIVDTSFSQILADGESSKGISFDTNCVEMESSSTNIVEIDRIRKKHIKDWLVTIVLLLEGGINMLRNSGMIQNGYTDLTNFLLDVQMGIQSGVTEFLLTQSELRRLRRWIDIKQDDITILELQNSIEKINTSNFQWLYKLVTDDLHEAMSLLSARDNTIRQLKAEISKMKSAKDRKAKQNIKSKPNKGQRLKKSSSKPKSRNDIDPNIVNALIAKYLFSKK